MTSVADRAPHNEADPARHGRFPRVRNIERLADLTLIAGLLVEVVVLSLTVPAFASVANFRDVAVQTSVVALVAVPTTMLLLTGYIDLSVGSTLALSAVTAGVLLDSGVSAPVAIVAGVGAGVAVGMVNGALSAGLGFSSIIVTLGGLVAVRGLARSVSGLSTITPSQFGDDFGVIGRGELWHIPVPVIITAAAFVAGFIVLRFSVWGRHIYGIGVNPVAAYLSGVSVRKIPFAVFAMTGAAAGLGGVILAARIDASPVDSIGNGFELDVLTAVLLGGVAFGGGRGRLSGVLAGLLFLALLQNGLTLMNVSLTGSLIARGVVLIAAAGLERVHAVSAGTKH